jgi:hypothetical protein
MLDLTQLLRIPRIDAGFDISADGTHLALAWNKTGEWQISEGELTKIMNDGTTLPPISF